MLKFDPADGVKLRALEMKIAEVLNRANKEKLEAAIAAFACARCARVLLDQYPEPTRLVLVDIIAAFLKREPGTEAAASSLLM